MLPLKEAVSEHHFCPPLAPRITGHPRQHAFPPAQATTL